MHNPISRCWVVRRSRLVKRVAPLILLWRVIVKRRTSRFNMINYLINPFDRFGMLPIGRAVGAPEAGVSGLD
jgi:hypothetical protein